MHTSALNNLIGHHFIELATVESTNNYATGLANSAIAAEGTVVFAWQQTAGKGQRGKKWFSAPGENIIISVILCPYWLSAAKQFLLNVAVSLSIKSFFETYADEPTSIKWSNDLYWYDRKAGGVLIENSWRNNKWLYSIVGIGININQTSFPEGLPNPVSLKQITGKSREVLSMSKELCQHLNYRYLQLRQGKYEKLLADYQQSLYRLNEPTKFIIKEAVTEGIIKGVQADGKLLLQTAEGLCKYSFGEISFVI